jgi:hypothetical protein
VATRMCLSSVSASHNKTSNGILVMCLSPEVRCVLVASRAVTDELIHARSQPPGNARFTHTPVEAQSRSRVAAARGGKRHGCHRASVQLLKPRRKPQHRVKEADLSGWGREVCKFGAALSVQPIAYAFMQQVHAGRRLGELRDRERERER